MLYSTLCLYYIHLQYKMAKTYYYNTNDINCFMYAAVYLNSNTMTHFYKTYIFDLNKKKYT